MQVSEARYRATAFFQTLVIPNSVQVREGRALSIRQKLLFEISGISGAQWDGTFGLHGPDTSYCAFCIAPKASNKEDSEVRIQREWFH